LLRRAGEAVLPVLPELMAAMIRRMVSAQTATFLQVCPSSRGCGFKTDTA
jgi:hypothetical protein